MNESLEAWIKSGLSAREIAEKLTCSYKTVYRRAADLGLEEELKSNGKKTASRDSLEAVLNAMKTSDDPLVIASVMGLTVERTYPYMAKAVNELGASWGKECEHCSKDILIFRGQGRFCSTSCARKWAQNKVTDSGSARRDAAFAETGRRNAEKTRGLPGKKGVSGRVWTDEEKKAHSKRIGEVARTEEFREKIRQANLGRVNSPETRAKISKAIRSKVEAGEWAGWSQRGVLQETYPEKYWRGVLENRAITFQQEVKIKAEISGKPSINSYFLDFVISIDGRKIDLEIDGSQHQDRVKADQTRDRYISSLGFEVYRIPWINPSNQHKKNLVEIQIQELENFLGLKD